MENRIGKMATGSEIFGWLMKILHVILSNSKSPEILINFKKISKTANI